MSTHGAAAEARADATTLRRGLAVIRALGAHHSQGPMAVTQLAELLEVDKSQISRTLKTLLDEGIVERDEASRGYRLTWELLRIVSGTLDHRLIELSRPVVRELVQAVQETGHLAVLEGAQVVTMFSYAPPVLMRVFDWTGSTVPAACTASGRALLLDRDRAELASLLGPEPLPGVGPNAARTVDELEQRLRQARALGYVVVREEFEAGLTAIAAPVRDFTGQVIASINVSGPEFRLGPRIAQVGAAVAAAAARVSEGMGAQAAAAQKRPPGPIGGSAAAGEGGARAHP